MNKYFFKNLRYDLPASLAVFFVAIPLCLGIAHASEAPVISGLITGVIGGIMVGFLSGSHLSVSGPAAGLTAIVAGGIAILGGFEQFLLAALIAGVIQLLLGIFKAGNLAEFFPNAVIRGMLSAIGLILITKEIPHLLGYDVEVMGVEEFALEKHDIETGFQSQAKNKNTLDLIINSIRYRDDRVALFGLSGIAFLFLWAATLGKRFKTIPGSLVVVVLSMLVVYIVEVISGNTIMSAAHLVNLPDIDFANLHLIITLPDFSSWQNPQVYILAITLALVASLETLLSTEALDKLDPQARMTPTSRELLSQGSGNIVTSLIGGIPMTAVIVRGSVNLSAGARTKNSTIMHGLWILLAALFLQGIINHIPLAALAAVLIYTGIKLVDIKLLQHFYQAGWSQLIPYISTVLIILFTDLLIGVICGLAIALALTLFEEYKSAVIVINKSGLKMKMVLSERISFLHRGKIKRILDEVPAGTVLEIDGSKTRYIDKDIVESFHDFKTTARRRNIQLMIGGLPQLSTFKDMENQIKESYERLFDNNKKWVHTQLANDPRYFEKLSEGQTPQYLFIGCSDSRVPAEMITGTTPGELFVHRNIANLVISTDVNLMSVLQYSVEVLNVKHIIICGHYGCGGVKASIEDEHHGLIDKWLRNIKDIYRLHAKELDEITDENEKLRKLVEFNVKEQVYNLLKTSFVQRSLKLYGFPLVHGWVYDINEGLIKEVEVNLEKEFPEFKKIYSIIK